MQLNSILSTYYEFQIIPEAMLYSEIQKVTYLNKEIKCNLKIGENSKILNVVYN